MSNDEAASMIKAIVEKCAPKETPLVDQLYLDYRANPKLFEATVAPPRREHSLGDPVGITLVSTLVIPIVVEIVSHVLEKSFDAIVNALRGRAKDRLSDGDIVRIAKAIADQTERSQ